MLKRLELFNAHRPVEVFQHWQKNDELLLNPPYQRGDVWGPVRRMNLIRSIVQGIPIPSIIINDRFRADWEQDVQYAVIDGKQRITTILMFLDDELEVPGAWFGEVGGIRFSSLPIGRQRCFKHIPMIVSEGTLKSLADEQRVFELVNFGGVPQGQSDNDQR